MIIKVLTFHNIPNYGAVLQAYALSKYLKKQGHNVEFINYQPDILIKPYRVFPNSFRFRPYTVKNFIRWIRFKGFNKKYFKLTKRYKTNADLINDPPVADVYIVGSDQVWNYELFDGVWDKAYFLNFGSDKTVRISYAASFGLDEILDVYKEELRIHIAKFNSISVREKNAVTILKEIHQGPIKTVVDPTLLINSYDEIIQSSQLTDYLLVYQLQNDPDIQEITAELSLKYGLKRININGSWQFWKTKMRPRIPTPAQWLGLIKNAEYIVTDSFHGIIFSILFNKRFLFIPLKGSMKNRNVRIENLLDILGLQRFNNITGASIDWQKVNNKLDELRNDSIQFLTVSLGLKKI